MCHFNVAQTHSGHKHSAECPLVWSVTRITQNEYSENFQKLQGTITTVIFTLPGWEISHPEFTNCYPEKCTLKGRRARGIKEYGKE